MSLLYLLLLWIFVQESLANGVQKGQEEDYCWLEAFQPRCLKNEVILMTSATYGRMRTGRCISAEEVAAHRNAVGEDRRYFGCSANVLPILDRACSGKNQCDIRLSDISAENIKPCFLGLTVYLEVTYSCVAIADESRSCVVTASPNPIYLVASKTCGTNIQPWTVEAPVGQKINLRLLYLNASRSDQLRGYKQHRCSSIGVIADKAAKRNTSICTNEEKREEPVYLSSGNTVEIFYQQSDHHETNIDLNQYIVKVHTVGCSNLIPPDDAWLKRNSDEILIGCYSSRKRWHLSCHGGKWIGVMGNCSEGNAFLERVATSGPKMESWNDRQVLTMVAIGGLTVAACLTILCTGVVCLRRFSAKSKKQSVYKTLNYDINSCRSKNLDPRIPTDGAADSTASDSRGFSAQQGPTYAVYAGGSDFSQVQNSHDAYKSNPPSLL